MAFQLGLGVSQLALQALAIGRRIMLIVRQTAAVRLSLRCLGLRPLPACLGVPLPLLGDGDLAANLLHLLPLLRDKARQLGALCLRRGASTVRSLAGALGGHALGFNCRHRFAKLGDPR